MDMGMENQGLAPGMECGNDARFASYMPRIETELEESIPYTGKEKIGHGLYVLKPEVVQFMGDGKDHMVMGAGEDSLLLFFKPLFYPYPVALRAGPVTAGVVPLSLIMTFRTGLHVASQFCSTAFDESLCCSTNIEGKQMG